MTLTVMRPKAWPRFRDRGRRALRAARREDGFSFPELVVAASITLSAAVIVMGLMLVAFRQSDNQSDRIVALDEARNGMLQMTNEVRSAAAIDSVSARVLDVLVHVPTEVANPYHWIRYKCVGNDQGSSQGLGGTCSRQDKDLHTQDCADDGSGPGCVVILRRITTEDTDSFAEPCDNYDPQSSEERHFCVKDNRTVQFSIFVDVPGAENPIELRNAVTARNCLDNQEQPIPCVDTSA